MKIVLSFLSFLFIVSFIGIYADEHDGETRIQQDLEEDDLEVLRSFINAKRRIPLEQKISNLSIEGDVRARWRYSSEIQNHEQLRGGEHGIYVFREDEIVNDEIYTIGERLPTSKNDFDVIFNLRFDYSTDCSWASVWVCYDNSPGVDDNLLDCCIDPEGYHGSGSCDNLCLKQAYFGYTFYKDSCTEFYVELGRRGQIYDAFDSMIQFGSRLDGIILTFERSTNFADTYLRCAGFVIDERVNHFGWIAEVGFLNICNSGLDFKYSFIDWVKRGRNRCFVEDPIGFKFQNSQFTLIYHLDPCWLKAPAKVYGALLWNHCAAMKTFRHHREIHIPRKNLGWYIGGSIGELVKEGDWAIEGMYAVVEAQCMPDNDVRFIGTGNIQQKSFTADARGYTNWKGWQFFGGVALTDNILLNTWVVYSKSDDIHIGGSHRYSKLRVETIYAF